MSRSNYSKISATLLILFTQSNAIADDLDWDPRPCLLKGVEERLIGKFKRVHPSRDELNRLSIMKISDLFPETEKFTVPGSSEVRERVKVSDEQTQAFKKNWDDLIHLRESLLGYNANKIKKAINSSGGQNGYPALTREHIESYKNHNLTLEQLQDDLIIDYNAQKYGAHGDFEGWQQYLAPKSSNFVAKVAMRGAKSVLSNLKDSIKGGIYFAVAGSLYKPVTDAYNRKFNAVTSKAANHLPEHKDLTESIEANQKLEKEALAIDFTQMATKEERLSKWAELESKFKKSHETIHKNQMDIPSLKTQVEQARKATAGQIQINRIAFLTSFHKLLEDKNPDTSTMALSLAGFKAQEMKVPSSDTEAALSKSATDEVLSKIADDPAVFQQFVKEFVETQKE